MRKFLTIVAFMLALLFVSPAIAGDECEVQDVCVAMFGDHTSPSSAVDDDVCIYFSQMRAGDVQLALYANPPVGEGPEGVGMLKHWNRHHPTQSKYCFGSWRLNEASWIMLCNDDNAVTLDAVAIATLRQTGELDVCVIGVGC